jgi:hypothetical protein
MNLKNVYNIYNITLSSNVALSDDGHSWKETYYTELKNYDEPIADK